MGRYVKDVFKHMVQTVSINSVNAFFLFYFSIAHYDVFLSLFFYILADHLYDAVFRLSLKSSGILFLIDEKGKSV